MKFRLLIGLCCAALLAACGGGGGGDGDGGSDGPSGSAGIRFNPGVLRATYIATTSASVKIGVDIVDTSQFKNGDPIHVKIVDNADVLEAPPFLDGSRANPALYTLGLQTSSSLPAGRYRGSLQLQLCKDEKCTQQYAGSPASLPYDITVTEREYQPRILASAWAVPFANTADASLLQRKIQISATRYRPLTWRAVADQPWLTVTPSGSSTQDELLITADPSSLPTQAVSYASITVSADTPGYAPVKIRVALWNDPASPRIARSLNYNSGGLVDKLRPYYYAFNGDKVLDIYNIHTGQPVGQIAIDKGVFGITTLSPDGSRLYTKDSADTLAVIDLDTRTRVATWNIPRPPFTGPYPSGPFDVIRPNGVEVVLIDRQGLVDGKMVGLFNMPPNMPTGTFYPFASSPDGRRIYTTTNNRQVNLAAFDIDYLDNNGGMLLVKPPTETFSSGYGSLTVSADNKRVYTATVGDCNISDARSLFFIERLLDDLYPNTGVRATWDDRVICSVDSQQNGQFWFRVYSKNRLVLRTYVLDPHPSGRYPGSIKVSADGMTVVVSRDGRTDFVPIAVH